MIRSLVTALLALFAIPVTAQVITSPTELPDKSNDRVITIDKAGGTLRPSQAKGAKLVRCPALPGFAYVAKGKVCPAPIVSTLAINAAGKEFATTLEKAAIAPVNVTGLPEWFLKPEWSKVYDGLTIQPISGTVFRGGIKFQSAKVDNLRNITFLSIDVGRRPDRPNVRPKLPEGFHASAGTNITIKRLRCGPMFMAEKAGGPVSYVYPRNGDCFAQEIGVGPYHILDIRGEDGGSDSLIDALKGRDLTVDYAYGRKWSRCLKSGALRTYVKVLDCGGTYWTGVEVKGNDTVVGTFRYDFTGMTRPITLFTVSKGTSAGASLTIGRCEFIGSPPKGTKLSTVTAGATLTARSGCKLP